MMETRQKILDALVEVASEIAEGYRLADEGGNIDKSWCAYNRRGLPGADPQGICSFGCHEEPSCHTDGPWPLNRLQEVLGELEVFDATAPTARSACERCDGEGVIATMGSHPGDIDFEPCDCDPER